MRKFYLVVTAIFVLSVIYFIVYVNSLTLQTLVNTSTVWGGVHIAADVGLFGGGITLILKFVSILRKH
jgi:hypothetical protein